MPMKDAMVRRSVFVIHHGALGDLITAFPLFLALKDAGFAVHLLCQEHLGTLAQLLGLVEKTYALESAIFASLFQETPDPRMTEIFKPHDTMLAISGSDTLVYSISRIFKKPIHSIAPRPNPWERIHVAKHLLLSCAQTGLIKFSGSVSEFPFFTGPGFFTDPIQKVDKKRIWIHPGAGSAIKRWPLGRFIETAALIHAGGFNPAFLLGPAEFSLEPALSVSAPAVPLSRVSEMTCLVNTLKSGQVLIGNDSGVSHLAAFLGLATAAVFGPTDPVRWKPLGPKVCVVQGDLDCSPCFETPIRSCDEPECLNRVTPRQVFKAFSGFSQRSGFEKKPCGYSLFRDG